MSNHVMNRITLKRPRGALFLFAAVLSSFSHGGVPDWNDEAIEWQDYAKGRELAQTHSKPALVVFYADWCATCHAYQQIFEDASVVEASKSFVMIRVNADEAPQLNLRFGFDGLYLPRVFVLGPQGHVAHDLYPHDTQFRYFVAATRPDLMLALMRGIGVEAARRVDSRARAARAITEEDAALSAR